MEISPNLKQLFNDHYTYDVVLRIDGKIYFAHRVILKYQSGYFLEYFDKSENNDKMKNGNYYIDCSCLINSRKVIKNWYDIIDKEEYKDKKDKIEFYYDYEIFGKFLSYFYGWPVYVRTNEQLFTIAYLAKKFKVTGLTKMMDGLLKYLPTTWQQNDIENWKVTLDICKWLELDQTQLEITNYLRKNEVGLNNINNDIFGQKKRKREEDDMIEKLSDFSSSEDSDS